MRSIYDQEMREIQRDSIHMCNLAAETLQDVMDAVRRRDFNVVDRSTPSRWTCASCFIWFIRRMRWSASAIRRRASAAR